ncbi:vWA domain-containing protein [Nonomuraea jabiensis]|uniref:vWA domain-containing protein n=1 Tax=Nonomuraea jabiensis TaxID=882448 RepID=UPI003449C4B5
MRARAILAALVLVAWPMPAPAAADPEPTALYDALDLKERPADYIVLLDTSGTMSSQQNAVKQQLKGLLKAKGKQDSVTLVRFDRRPYHRSALETDEDVDGLPTPVGEYTDIGRALEWVVRYLREHPSRLAAVMLVSDGIQEPAPGSPYGSANGPAWDKLRDQAAGLKPQPLLYTFPFGGADVRRHQDEIVERVFPANAQILDPRQSQATKDLSMVKDDSLRAEARRRVAADLKRGVAATWKQPDVRLDPARGTGSLTLDVRSQTEVLPLELRAVEVEVSDGKERVTGRSVLPAPIRIEPGRTVPVPIELSWAQPSLIRVQPVALDLSRTVRVRATVQTPWEGDLGLLGLSYGKQQIGTDAARVSGSYRGAPSWWAAAAAVVLVAALIVLSLWWRRARRRRLPKMTGVLLSAYVKDAEDAWDEHTLGPVHLGGRRSVRTAELAPELDLPGGSVKGTVDVRAAADGITITYAPEGLPGRSDTATCPLGRRVMINGVEFIYRTTSED